MQLKISLSIVCLLFLFKVGFAQEEYTLSYDNQKIKTTSVTARNGVSNYNLTLLPGQHFVGTRYLLSTNNTTLNGNYQTANLPSWLNSVTPSNFTSTGCTDVVITQFDFTAPNVEGTYTYTLIEGNDNWNDLQITLTVDAQPTADTVTITGDIFSTDTIYQTLQFNGFSLPCITPYFPNNSGLPTQYYIPNTVNWMTIQPDSFLLANSQQQIVEKIFQSNIAGTYQTLETLEINGVQSPNFTYYKYIVEADTLGSCMGNWQHRTIAATRSYNGIPHTGTMSYRCGSGSTIDKPLIIVEGFEIEGDYDVYDMENNYGGLLSGAESLGYDVIFLDLHQNRGYIQNNAYLLQEVIEEVNGIAGVDSIAVFGVSMGGLIARYAIADMEQDNKSHRVKLYGSIDSPHRGANIPLGIQYVGQVLDLEPMRYVNTNVVTLKIFSGADTLNVTQTTTLYEIFEILSSAFDNINPNNSGLSDAFELLNELQAIAQSPAAQQMLMVQAEDLTILNAPNYTHNYDPLPLFDSFMTEYHNLGYPQHCRNIAISNGAKCNDFQNNSTNNEIIDTTIVFDLDTLNIPLLDSIEFELAAQNADVAMPNNVLDINVIFHYSFELFGFTIPFTTALDVDVFASDTIPRDFLSGGYVGYNANGFELDNFSFVPTYSALDVDYDSLDIAISPFDNYAKADTNTFHPFIYEQSLNNWLLAELGGNPQNSVMCGDTLPDLQIVDAVLIPDTTIFKHGDNFNIDIEFKNFGTQTALPSFAIVYLSDDEIIDNGDIGLNVINVDLLMSNQTENKITPQIPIANTISYGDKFILIETDATKSIAETKENNNFYKIPITIIDTTITNTPTLPWEVANSTIKHDIIIPSDVFTSIKGTQITENDYIGGFYDDGGLFKCGGYVQWDSSGVVLRVNGNDLTTPTKEGFDSTEVIQLKIYRLDIEQELPLTAVYRLPSDDSTGTVNATNTFIREGVSLVDSIYTIDTLSISLSQSWNMIASNVHPPNMNIENITNSIVNNIALVKDITGQAYIPDPFLAVNTIGQWNIREGYKIRMLQQDTLHLFGHSIVPELSPIDIQQGWQIIPFYPKNETDISMALAAIDAEIEMVKDALGNTYIPSFSINTIGNMNASQGYQLKANNNTTLLYNQNPIVGRSPVNSSGNTNTIPVHFTNINITKANSTIIFPMNRVDSLLNIGDEIGVFNTQNELCGVGVYNGQNFAITVWEKENAADTYGMTTGENYTFRIWYQQYNQEVPLSVITYEVGDSLYAKDAIAVIKDIYAPTLTNTTTILETNDIICYPNPTADRVTFRLNLPTAQTVSIYITDVQGKQHTVLNEQNLTTGQHDIPFDLQGWAAGVYFYQVIVDNQVFTNQLTVVK
ncbi:MAG: T9SS type A sorting domain-containing protein [Saprospiraceae bacterium]